MRYILRTVGDDAAMFNNIHLAKLVGHMLTFSGTPNVEIYDTIAKRVVL